MKNQLTFRSILATAAVAAGAITPLAASAQTAPAPGPWRYSASVYGYFPSVGGTTSFPTNGGGSVGIDYDVLDKLKGFFMGSFEAHNGRWGVYTDYMYLRLGDERQNSRNFTIGGTGIGVNTTANLDTELTGTIWSLAGLYRLRSEPGLTVDALGGVRMFKAKPSLSYSITGDIGNLPPLDRSGSVTNSETNWDAIVGVKGRYALGSTQRWSLPFYLDIGTGESSMTWQAAAGVSYGFSWGELTAMWRYLGYDMKSGKKLQDINFNGPMVGATWRF